MIYCEEIAARKIYHLPHCNIAHREHVHNFKAVLGISNKPVLPCGRKPQLYLSLVFQHNLQGRAMTEPQVE